MCESAAEAVAAEGAAAVAAEGEQSEDSRQYSRDIPAGGSLLQRLVQGRKSEGCWRGPWEKYRGRVTGSEGKGG